MSRWKTSTMNKTVAIAALAMSTSVFTAQADADWTALGNQGIVATIHTANSPLPHRLYLHTARITPMIHDLGIRLSCNEVELPQYPNIDDPATAKCTDSIEGATWNWIFFDYNGHAMRIYVRKESDD
jgi:hypothetical protein